MEVLMVIFTAVMATSTVVYTLMSYRQWKATRFSADIARLTSFINLFIQYHQWVEEKKRLGESDANMWERFEPVMLEVALQEFIKDIDFKKNKAAVAYFSQFEGLLRGNNIDPGTISVLRPIWNKLKE